MTRDDPLAGDEGHQVEPVRADVADRPQRAAALRLEAPVPVALEEQPVLEVAAGHQPDVADVARRDDLVRVLVERVEADVEVHGVDQAARRGEPRPARRTPRRSSPAASRRRRACRPRGSPWPGGRGGRSATSRGRRRRRDRRGASRARRRPAARRGPSARACAALRRAAEDAAHLDADPAQGLDVDRADEARPDDGGADVGDPAHGRSHRSSGRPCGWAARLPRDVQELRDGAAANAASRILPRRAVALILL